MQDERNIIRNNIRAQRNHLTTRQRETAAIHLKQQLINNPIINNAQRISVYIADDGEIDPQLWLFWAEENQKTCYLPCVISNNKTLIFAQYESTMPMSTNRYGIFEPCVENQTYISSQELDVILVPLVAFDLAGHRLGRGAGYYDRTFAYLNDSSYVNHKPLLIGLAYEFQRIDKINITEMDVTLNAIITDKSYYPVSV